MPTVTICQYSFFFLVTGKYTDNYIQYPGKYVKNQASVAIPNINSADLCAYQCNHNATCKSFDYCDNKICYLKTKHFLEIPSVLVASSLTCSHYSSKFFRERNSFKTAPSAIV